VADADPVAVDRILHKALNAEPVNRDDLGYRNSDFTTAAIRLAQAGWTAGKISHRLGMSGARAKAIATAIDAGEPIPHRAYLTPTRRERVSA
jgi:hypothetical protein